MQYESPSGGAGIESYVDPNPALGTQGSIVRAAAVENIQREMHDTIEDSGLTPDRGDLTQLRQAIDARIAAAIAAATLVTPGTLRVSAGPNPGPNEYLCNGAAVSRAGDAALFGEIGILWGAGDGSTTFNLPDLRSRALMVAGAGTGLTARTLGLLLGEETHTLTVAELVEHSHDVKRELADSDSVAGTGNGHLVGDGNEVGSIVTITGASGGGVQSTGDGTPFNVIQPSAVVNVFIHR